MTAQIDLSAYAQEVKAFSSLADSFVPKASTQAFRQIEKDLLAGISSASPEWTWSTTNAVLFQPSELYDGLNKKPKPAHFALSFTCSFARPQNVSRKRAGAVWEVVDSSTHIKILREDNAALEFHFDYKNRGQLGPQLHIQVSESQTKGLPIPRLLAAAFLPTDCADVMLCELHPVAWEQRQRAGTSQHDVAVVRNGQEHRTVAFLSDIRKQWDTDSKRTRFSLLQSYSAGFAVLPSHSGFAKKSW